MYRLISHCNNLHIVLIPKLTHLCLIWFKVISLVQSRIPGISLQKWICMFVAGTMARLWYGLTSELFECNKHMNTPSIYSGECGIYSAPKQESKTFEIQPFYHSSYTYKPYTSSLACMWTAWGVSFSFSIILLALLTLSEWIMSRK